MKSKSPKDLAFDKERAKYRKQIRELDLLNRQKILEISDIKEELAKEKAKNEELQEWIERLLEYTEMSNEDFKMLLDAEKVKKETNELISEFFGIGGRFFNRDFF